MYVGAVVPIPTFPEAFQIPVLFAKYVVEATDRLVVLALMNDELVPVNVVTANTEDVVVPTVRFCMYALVAVRPVAERLVVEALVIVELVRVEFVANRDDSVAPIAERLVVLALVAVRFVKKPEVKLSPVPDIAVDEPFVNVTFASVVAPRIFNVPVV